MVASENLEAAYLQTTYRVADASGPVGIRVGVRNAALDRILDRHRVSEWVFITASNPGSHALPEQENACRNAGLEQMLRDQRRQYLHGNGVPDESGWQAERSFLVLGITKREAIALAKRWHQRAIVCGTLESAPELVWID
jgi:hypothetical protein